jgi:hypothetical protein
MFKVGGKRKYASGPEAKQFFSSITFKPFTEKLITYAPRTGGFTVRIPSNYSYNKNDAGRLSGLVEDLFAYRRSSKEIYGVRHAVFNDFNYLEHDTFELSQLAKNTLVNYSFSENQSIGFPGQQKFPSAEFSGKSVSGASMFGKLIIKGVHYYLVYQISEKGIARNNDFFGSFGITDFKYVNPLKEITDNQMYFKATDEVTENALSRFTEAYTKALKKSRPASGDTSKADHDYRSDSKLYYSHSGKDHRELHKKHQHASAAEGKRR